MVSWEKVSWHRSRFTTTEGTSTTITSIYRITTDYGTYIITQISRELPSGEFGLWGFHITDDIASNQTARYQGDWTITLLNILTYGLILAMLIHCIKSKLRLKLLLILLIFVQGGFSITNSTTGGMLLFMVRIFDHSSFLAYDDGLQIIILLPLGAIIYWFIHKKFKKEIIEKSVDEPISDTNIINIDNN